MHAYTIFDQLAGSVKIKNWWEFNWGTCDCACMCSMINDSKSSDWKVAILLFRHCQAPHVYPVFVSKMFDIGINASRPLILGEWKQFYLNITLHLVDGALSGYTSKLTLYLIWCGVSVGHKCCSSNSSAIKPPRGYTRLLMIITVGGTTITPIIKSKFWMTATLINITNSLMYGC